MVDSSARRTWLWLNERGSDGVLGRLDRPLVEHSYHLTSHPPGVAGDGRWVTDQVEDEHLALPDWFTLKRLLDLYALAEA